ncbi:apolipoprotein A-I [Carettochelys insculpta]|uniref:apolipoprotein A-I n=1 Tax=Carettochelys insculpta TaxID=44489 RepID=UPI003EBA0074
MKAGSVILTLLFLTGTQARYFWQHDDPQTPVDRFKDMIQVYLETIKASGKEAVTQFEASAVGKQLDLKLAENLDSLSVSVQKLQEDLAPYYKEAQELWLKDTEALRKELTKDLEDVKQKIQPFLEQFYAKWVEELEVFRQKLVPIGEELKEMTRQKLEVVQQKLTPVAEEARDRLRGHMEELRKALTPHGEELRLKVSQKLQEVREKGFPQAAEYQAKVIQHLTNFREKATPLVQDFKERLSPYVENVKTQFLALLDRIRMSMTKAN